MTREEQDKLWAELSEESRENIRKDYASNISSLPLDDVKRGDIYSYECLFGKHNIQPPLTYEDVAKELFEDKRGYVFDEHDRIDLFSFGNCGLGLPLNCTSKKQAEKLQALNKLLNVAKFLNKNEDDSEWVAKPGDANQEKWAFCINAKGQLNYFRCAYRFFSVVYFRSKEDCKKAVQILGEDVVMTALTPDY